MTPSTSPRGSDRPAAPTDTWRARFEPIQVGRLRVALVEHAGAGPGPELVLEPAETFGAGTHASTRLALTLIDRHLSPGTTMLDIGSGSGVLGIGALFLGAATVDAVDTDPHAVETTADNARRNRVADRVRARHGSIEEAPNRPYDLIGANLLLSAHRAVAPGIASRAHSRTLLIVAGILSTQEGGLSAVHPSWDIVDREDEDDWAGLVLTPG